MELVTRVKKELEKYDLEFIIDKEYNTKFKGKIKDKKTGIEMPYELEKILQYNAVDSHCKNINESIKLYIKLIGGKQYDNKKQ